MCSIDKMLSRAILQILGPQIDALLSERCYGYRRGLGTKDIVDFAAREIEKGYQWVVELDISNFFDTIPHKELLGLISKLIDDDVVVDFISSFVTCVIADDEREIRLAKGIIQGMPLSPLFSNIFMTDLDIYCENKYGGYCRYGDDIRVLTRTKAEGTQVLNDIKNMIESKGLLVNKKKCGVFEAINRPWLGYSLSSKGGHILISRNVRRTKSVYHLWQSSVIKEIDHNYHITKDGILTKKDFTVLFENKNEKKYIPVEVIDSLSIYSNVIFSSNFFELANNEGISVNLIDKCGEQIGRFIPQRWKKDFRTEYAQMRFVDDEKRRLKLAISFQTANIFNMRASLRYYERRSHNEKLTNAIKEISEIMEKVKKANSVSALMIYEAQARQLYYHCFNIIMGGEKFKFVRRTRRPPQDPLNAMISLGNTLLYTRFANEIYQSRLDIRFGILHSSVRRQESLNLDLADLFKPMLVDRTIFTLVNRSMINEISDFEELEMDGVYMNYLGKQIFIREFENKLSQIVTIKNTKVSYGNLIHKEVKKVEDYFRKDIPYKPYKYVN